MIEDLGSEPVVAGDPPAPIEARYEAAVDVLAALHREPLPDVLPVEPGVDYALPRYDMEALLIEVELLLDWYLPQARRQDVRRQARRLSRAVARRAACRWSTGQPTWVLRDFHSPNLLWLPEREGIARIGLLDFQDAVMGSPAYDLASLLQDARVDVPEMMEIALLSRYTRARLQGRSAASTRRPSRALTRRWPRSAPPRFSASSRGSTGATASRNICVICRAYGPICNARWRIRRWRRCTPGTESTCRR